MQPRVLAVLVFLGVILAGSSDGWPQSLPGPRPQTLIRNESLSVEFRRGTRSFEAVSLDSGLRFIERGTVEGYNLRVANETVSDPVWGQGEAIRING